ncbi:hypothetical protein ACNHKD_00640 [Methylocystis sp. JAN1]|uniref:hypothetical protein n=1 Tax=Methylocystis sp. JAN1 TaxID=3397211 RepID=UPI003FA1E998
MVYQIGGDESGGAEKHPFAVRRLSSWRDASRLSLFFSALFLYHLLQSGDSLLQGGKSLLQSRDSPFAAKRFCVALHLLLRGSDSRLSLLLPPALFFSLHECCEGPVTEKNLFHTTLLLFARLHLWNLGSHSGDLMKKDMARNGEQSIILQICPGSAKRPLMSLGAGKIRDPCAPMSRSFSPIRRSPRLASGIAPPAPAMAGFGAFAGMA